MALLFVLFSESIEASSVEHLETKTNNPVVEIKMFKPVELLIELCDILFPGSESILYSW
jgi:hypothetical protein